MWTPDVYEGAPTPVTAYLSVASKAAGFAAAIRVFQTALPAAQSDWITLFAVVAAATMTVGNVVALAQSNIKRMLAYSSIAQAGYILVGVAAASDSGVAAVLFYLLAYTATNLAAFTAVIAISRLTASEQLTDYRGLHQRAPWLAFALAVSLLSLATKARVGATAPPKATSTRRRQAQVWALRRGTAGEYSQTLPT